MSFVDAKHWSSTGWPAHVVDVAGSAEKVIVWAAARERRRDTGRRENCMLMIGRMELRVSEASRRSRVEQSR